MPRFTVRSESHAPVVAEPDRVGRPRHVDRPVALVAREVHLVVARERVERRQVPRAGFECPSCGSTAARLVGALLKVKKPARWMNHGAAVVDVDVLGADLQVVLVLVHAEVERGRSSCSGSASAGSCTARRRSGPGRGTRGVPSIESCGALVQWKPL